MERKIIVQGKGGYTIYLPKKWVDRKKLKRGDPITITESESSLVIGSPAKGKKSITIEITDDNRKDIANILTHIYRRGFDSIKILGTDEKLLNDLRNTVNDCLLGFEVTERGKKECKIENISEPTEAKYDVMLRRIFLIIKETHEIVKDDFEACSFKRKKEVEELRKQQDKFIFFCRRVLTKEKYMKDPVLEWELLTFLMHIEHAYHYLYKYASENRVEKDSKINEMIENLGKYFGLFYDSYFKKEIKSIHRINSLKKEFQFGKCISMMEKGKNPVAYSYLREIFRLIQLGTSPVLSGLFEETLE